MLRFVSGQHYKQYDRFGFLPERTPAGAAAAGSQHRFRRVGSETGCGTNGRGEGYDDKPVQGAITTGALRRMKPIIHAAR
ncbi:MAG: hypothetical protein MZV70_39420 [Desulfobacterales bacterium]|nr:hypothetical protein [Desulfobacterales bacterium]